MISAIVCSRDAQAFALVERNLRATIGNSDLEVIRIDNSKNQLGICAAYNRGVFLSHGDILLFVHEDVFHLERNWGPKLEQKYLADESLGMVGVAGTQVLYADPPIWTRAGMPWLFGKVVHELDQGTRYFMTIFSKDSGDRPVVALDGCWLSVRRKVFDTCQFDASTFPGFHFYDLDICLQAQEHWKIIASTDILIKHRSAGGFREEWKQAASQFAKKWKTTLPLTIAGVALPDQLGEDFFNVDLKGKVPQNIIGE